MIRTRQTISIFFMSALSLALALPAALKAEQSLIITPSVFDFGWCPDNSKISAEFILRNSGADIIPITGVQPTCGCTASQFTPGDLSSNQETKVVLTFNTRGYAGSAFSKAAAVKTDSGLAEYNVKMMGHVLDPNAKLMPDKNGIVGFEPKSKEKKKTISLTNKNDKDLNLEIVQKPASWASVNLDASSVKAGASVNLDVTIDSPSTETRDTSVTIESSDGTATSRTTVAIRTGEPPTPVRAATPPKPAATPKPATTSKPAPSKKPASNKKKG